MASKNTNTKTPNPNNPSSLKPRYEIRKLGPEHSSWATAIIMHSNLFHSPLWPVLYPENLTKRIHDGYKSADYLVNHQISSDMSFGVFDTEYQFKRPESEATGGKLYWDEKEASIQESEGKEAEGKRLLEQMDFPLVSVALSYDGINPLDLPQMKPLMGVLPHFGLIYHILATSDPRDPASLAPTDANQVLMRNATATRPDYEGEQNMSGLARWLMREAAQRGYKSIGIECVHDAVTHVWSKPEDGFKGSVICEFDTGEWKDEEGNIAFAPAKQRITRVFVDLKPQEVAA
ncbi:hypothetical protein P154DRAFT_65615 [Amniculicola lignicola CBS 123094]|uniref:N-acetyltransferase domain-containing protein n=1 Tax=Amniculicola lignicola CBS 123094 TaxID=1392246 RepID=A0A6A5WY93_9PLEO|nr:hypothetical protein P154DRAFT_65615 [Amniculicola lignicola CBS 123094]